jgi:addiction module HigA family antidote
MVEYKAMADSGRCPPHPGAVIEDILEDLSTSKSEIASLLGISRQQFHAVLAGRQPVTPTTAAKLGKLFGNGAAIWLRLQAAHDAWHAEREVDVSAIPTLEKAA